MTEFYDVASVVDILEGALSSHSLPNGSQVCVFRHDGAIGAVSDFCTHAEFQISDGVLHADGSLECVWHGARFDCHTGEVRRQPATRSLPVYPVRIEHDRVMIGGEPVPT